MLHTPAHKSGTAGQVIPAQLPKEGDVRIVQVAPGYWQWCIYLTDKTYIAFGKREDAVTKGLGQFPSVTVYGEVPTGHC